MDDDSFQDQDSILYDVTMPYTGTYYLQVKTFVPADQLRYRAGYRRRPLRVVRVQLRGHARGRFASSRTMPRPLRSPAAMAGDTLIGGSGDDTLIGSSANDLIATAPGDVVLGGSGADTIDSLPSGLSVTGSPLALTGSFVASNPDVSYTTTWHVIRQQRPGHSGRLANLRGRPVELDGGDDGSRSPSFPRRASTTSRSR